LRDSIIHFGESLNEDVLNRAFYEGSQCDLLLCLGSSLRVAPASLIPQQCAQDAHKKLIIVNLQKTPLDGQAEIVIHGHIDEVMEMLMNKIIAHSE